MPNTTPVIVPVSGRAAAVTAVAPPVVVTPLGPRDPVVIQPAPPEGPEGPPGPPGVGVVVSATEPANPQVGMIWVTP